MMPDDQVVISAIREAFKGRRFPSGRIIHPRVDISQDIEAKQIDTYFRGGHFVLDRRNAVLSAFYYLSSEAALWIMPLYMISIVEKYKQDDFIIDVMFEALARGHSGSDCGYNPKMALEMKALASAREAAAICCFCRWLLLKASDNGIEDRVAAALKLWCVEECEAN